VEWVTFSPNDAQLASASVDGTVRVWDLAKLTQLELFVAHTSRVWSVAWFPDNTTLASAGADGTVRLWHLGTSRLERVASLPTGVLQLCASARNGPVWSAASKGMIWAWDVRGPPRLFAGPTEEGANVASARNADVLAVTLGDDHVRLYDGGGQPLSSSIELPLHVGQVALSPGGDLLAVSDHKGEVHLYELPAFRLRWSRTMENVTCSVEFTRQGDELVVADGDGFVAQFNVADGATNVTLRPRQVSRVTASPNGRPLAAGCLDRAIRIWDREQGKEVACLQGHDGAVNALAFAPDGRTLASGTSAGSVTLWHAPSWQELGSFKTSLAAINDLTFSAQGNTLAIGGRTANDGGQRILWETKTVDD
jgi:WD40 repeat protein